MHGVLITFDCAATADHVAAPFADYATALRTQPGFLTKTWVSNDQGFGGFHVFADKASADAYLGSDLAAELMATDGFDNFVVEHFDVLDELSAMTGGVPVS